MQVFGKVMVCRDLETATRVARDSGHLNCVTIKGDQVSKKGTMTGGYLDLSRCGLPLLLPSFLFFSSWSGLMPQRVTRLKYIQCLHVVQQL